MIGLIFCLNSYAEVRMPGFLYIYKDKKVALSDRNVTIGAQGDAVVVVDLREVVDFSVVAKSTKGEQELIIALPENKNVKLK